MRNIYVIPFLILLFQSAEAQVEKNYQTVVNVAHPRLLLLEGEEEEIKRAIERNEAWQQIHLTILQECDAMTQLPTLERIQIGRRLLSVSRELIRRVFYLSYAYRMTGEEKYFLKAEQEMLKVSQFSDWNPSHFLDVAEMTLGLSIGYDWLYNKLSDQSKLIIKEAIIEKGLKESFGHERPWFLSSKNNWNQVCNTGLAFGAWAVYEDSDSLAQSVIDRSIENIKFPMQEYGPDGAYPEGYIYWGYGTSFNVLFLNALEKIYNSDFGLSETPGFLESGAFMQNMVGKDNACFNWGDSREHAKLNPAMFWFAQKNNDPSLLWTENQFLKEVDFSDLTKDRLLPAILIWGKDVDVNDIMPPTQKFWQGQGLNPVCLMRTSWTDPDGIYLGYKLGSPSVSHAHMDVGSFIMEADGVRWASDFGMQEYESLESKGIKLSSRGQHGQRWTVFRLNNYVHNTLTMNGQLQLVNGYAKIEKSSDAPEFSFAVSDLSSLYRDQVDSAKRGVGIVNSKFVVIRDELQAGEKPTVVRWTMLTEAEVKAKGKNNFVLTKDGKTLRLQVDSSERVTMKTWSTEPTTDYDAPNPGTILVGFEYRLKPGRKANVQVFLVPESANDETIDFEMLLDDW